MSLNISVNKDVKMCFFSLKLDALVPTPSIT